MDELTRKRLNKEQADLSIKLKDLDTFIKSTIFPTLDVDEQKDLVSQKKAMGTYRAILNRRVARANA